MSSSIPLMSGREVVSKFERLGWRFVRQKGSHTKFNTCDLWRAIAL